jgi:hypothetical protein
MASAANPSGAGHAAGRIAAALRAFSPSERVFEKLAAWRRRRECAIMGFSYSR